MNEPLDPRVSELLSARLDGALTDEERAAADAWVVRSPSARAEHDGLAAVKAALAALPPVEPPEGFFEAMLERGSPRPEAAVLQPRRRSWNGSPAALVASALATAAAWVLVAGSGSDPVRPPVDDVEVAALTGGGRFAVDRQEGEVDWSELPRGERGEEDGAQTWVDLTTDRGLARVVVARDGVVYTLVSDDLDAEDLIDIGADLPGDGDDSLLDRVRGACESLVDALSLE